MWGRGVGRVVEVGVGGEAWLWEAMRALLMRIASHSVGFRCYEMMGWDRGYVIYCWLRLKQNEVIPLPYL